jgi:hypothetical protein
MTETIVIRHETKDTAEMFRGNGRTGRQRRCPSLSQCGPTYPGPPHNGVLIM